MGTGAAVNTGDLITAAKMNLKLEDLTDVAQVELLDQSGAGTETLNFLVTENLSADRNLTITVNDAARTIDLGGNLTLANAFVTSGNNSLTLTTTGATNVTLPTTGTLAVLAANTFTGAQTFAGNVDTVINISSSPIIDIGADVFAAGIFIDIAYDTAEVLSGDLTGINIDFSGNLTFFTDADVFGYRIILSAYTQSSGDTTRIYGFTLPTAGAIVQDTTSGTVDWRGLNIVMPEITQTTGTVTAYGLHIEEGTVNSGTSAGIYVNAAIAIDLVTNGNRIDFDADNDTSIRASSDDVLTYEIGGVDAIVMRVDADSGAVATATIQAGTAVEIGISVVQTAMVVGTSGSLVIPYLESTGAAGTDALFGDQNGSIAINRDTDTGPTNTIEVRANGSWVSVAVTGYIIQSELDYTDPKNGKQYLTHPAQINADRTKIDETICFVCGDQMYAGQPGGIVMYPNAIIRNNDLHAIFGHAHPELEPEFVKLKEEVEQLREIVAERLPEVDRELVAAGR